MPALAIFFLPLWKKGDSRPLVEDGCRSVIGEGGPEVDLHGTVTVGRGGVGRGTMTIRLNGVQTLDRYTVSYVTTPKEIYPLLKFQVEQTVVAYIVSFSKRVVGELWSKKKKMKKNSL